MNTQDIIAEMQSVKMLNRAFKNIEMPKNTLQRWIDHLTQECTNQEVIKQNIKASQSTLD